MVENISSGTGKLPIAVLMVVIITAAGFAYALTSGFILYDPVNPPDPTNTTDSEPIEAIDIPLRIVGDEEMVEAVEEYGFLGSGTHSDPYIIENLSIVSTHTCIFIQNVEVSFIVRNCNLSVTTLDYWGICIYIGSCVDASVIRCRVEGGSSGVELFDTHDSFISECDVKYSFFGINISGSHESRIEGNRISNTTWGVTFVGSNLTTVLYNEIIYNEIGINSQFSFRCMVDDNSITRNSYGIEVQGRSQNWTISGNDILYNTEIGIRLDDTTSEMVVYKNRLGWNSANNALDDGIDNVWDYESGLGNSWHDYIGSGWYTIPGTAESIDHYPLLLTG